MKRILLIILTTMVLLSFAVTALAITNSGYDKAIKHYNSGKYSEAVNRQNEFARKLGVQSTPSF